jgi:hypothetical protein
MKRKENPIHEREIAKFEHAKYIIRAYDNKNELVAEEWGTNHIEMKESSYSQQTIIDDAIVVREDRIINRAELWYKTNKKTYEMVGMRRFPGFEMRCGDTLHITFRLNISWVDNEMTVFI